MKLIQNVALVAVLFSASATMVAHAEETMTEKAGAKANDVKRELKKAGHRVQEETCMEGDLTCAGRKAKNRVKEGADATVDGAKELKNKVD